MCHRWYIRVIVLPSASNGITRSLLPQNNNNLPLPFFVQINQFFSWIIFINYHICILTGSTGYYFLVIVYVI